MSRIKWTIFRYYLIETTIGMVVLLPIYLFVSHILKIDATLIYVVYLLIWYISMRNERRSTIEYWVQLKFRDEILHVLAAEGFVERLTEENKVLFEKRLRFKRRYFATLTDLPTHLLLRVAEKYEKKMDATITTDMLAGGGSKLKKRSLYRNAKTPQSRQIHSQQPA